MCLRSFILLITLAVHPLLGQVAPSVSPLLSNDLRKSGLPENEESVTIPLGPTLVGYVVRVQIDGEPVQLLVDTGAPLTILSPELAKKLGLRTTKSDSRVFSTTGEQVAAHLARTKRINLAGAWTTNEQVMISRLPQGCGADGLLGISTLIDWDVRIDPVAKKLTLFPAGEAPKLAKETVLPLTCKPALRGLQLSVPVSIGTHVVEVHPDTGFGGVLSVPSVLVNKFAPEAMAEALPALLSGENISGKFKTRATKLPDFTFGPDNFRGLPVDVVEVPPGRTPDGYAFLGLNILRHYVMTYSFSAKELRLKPVGTAQEITRESTAGLNLGFEAGGRVVIMSVVPNGPGSQVGLRAGDELLEIEGRPIKTMKPAEFSAFKQLPPGSAVKITYRRGEADPAEVILFLASS